MAVARQAAWAMARSGQRMARSTGNGARCVWICAGITDGDSARDDASDC
jgi:hypothetical protein